MHIHEPWPFEALLARSVSTTHLHFTQVGIACTSGTSPQTGQHHIMRRRHAVRHHLPRWIHHHVLRRHRHHHEPLPRPHGSPRPKYRPAPRRSGSRPTQSLHRRGRQPHALRLPRTRPWTRAATHDDHECPPRTVCSMPASRGSVPRRQACAASAGQRAWRRSTEAAVQRKCGPWRAI